jgi:hypothetical protein
VATPNPSAISADDPNATIARHGAGSRFGWVSNRWTPWIVGTVFVLLTLRLAAFVNRYAVNIVFWDQWDFLQGLFDGADAWTLFRWQHGPQRQGIGNLIHAALYSATGWNGRADAIASAIILILAAAGALWLVKRVCGSLSPWDVAVPLIFLTTASAEMYVVVPNLAHGPLPVLFLVGYGLALTIPAHVPRCLLLVLVNFLAVNTGFTLLLGGITPAVLLIQASASSLTARQRAVSAAGIAACLGTVALFFHGFVLHPAAECFQFPYARPWEYIPYTGFVLARPFGFQGGNEAVRLLVGAVVACAVAAFAAFAAFRLVQSRGNSALWAVTASFTGFALLFASTTAVGRVCLGLASANASRYIPYMLPAMLALYLVIRTVARSLRAARALLPLLLAAFIAKERSELGPNEAAAYHEFKREWRDCYLRLHDIYACDMRAGHQVHPAPAATHLQEKLDWLESRRYSFFRDQ